MDWWIWLVERLLERNGSGKLYIHKFLRSSLRRLNHRTFSILMKEITCLKAQFDDTHNKSVTRMNGVLKEICWWSTANCQKKQKQIFWYHGWQRNIVTDMNQIKEKCLQFYSNLLGKKAQCWRSTRVWGCRWWSHQVSPTIFQQQEILEQLTATTTSLIPKNKISASPIYNVVKSQEPHVFDQIKCRIT